MKKRRISFMLNIFTICLAITAIVIGVYSLRQAMLNINGSVGFTAHNVKAKIEAWISGFAETADGTPVTGKVQITPDNGLLLDGKDASLNLGATKGTGTNIRYFSDIDSSGNGIPKDIVVEIKITNMTTVFNVLATVDLANSKATTDALKDKIKVDCDRSSAVLGTIAGTTETTFTFTISLLQNSDGSYGDESLISPDTSNVQIKMNLEKTEYSPTSLKANAVEVKKFTQEYMNEVNTNLGVEKGYATKFPYYVEMGERDGLGKVKWLIIGTRTVDSDNNETYARLTVEDTTAFDLGLMLNKTYVMLSEKILYTESTDYCGLSFQNDYNDSSSPYLNNSNYSACDYATSNVRNYLIGADNVYQGYDRDDETQKFNPNTHGHQKVNLLSDYNLTNDPLYAKIQGRTLTSLYKGLYSEENGDVIWSNNSTIPGTTTDKLWLLSGTEWNSLYLESETTDEFMTNIYGVSNSSGVSWWLRSGGSNSVDIVDSAGMGGNEYVWEAHGVRPAFLF